MKKQIIKSEIIFLFIISTMQLGFAQQQNDIMAFGGPNGIYINLGVEIVSPENPSNGIIGYKIERQLVGEKSWTALMDISAPNNFNEFLDRIYKTNLLLLDSIPANELPLNIIWEKSQRFMRIDSLKYYGNPLVVRIALGLCYLDKDVSPKTNYLYKISKIESNGNEKETFVTNLVSFPPKITEGRIIYSSKESSDNAVQIKWENIDARFARFKVFRSVNFDQDFNEIFPSKYFLSKEGKDLIICIDSLVRPNDVYQYYIIPIDYYQNYGRSSDTVSVAAFNYGSIIPPYNMSVNQLDSLGALILKWQMDQSNIIISTKILRSEYYDSNFVEIAEVQNTDTSYIDRTADPMKVYYYYLQLNDQFGEIPYKSAKVFGLYKSKNFPIAPFNLLSAEIEKGVKLIWERPDTFIKAYHIYRNVDETMSLKEITSVFSTDSVVQFVDTTVASNQNKYYYYSIRSENTSGLLSDFSDTISVISKTNFVLRAPHDVKGYYDESGVNLYWENMFAEDPSISGYQIFRRLIPENDNKSTEFKPVIDSILSPKQNNFTDHLNKQYGKFQYAVKALDIFGNVSPFSNSIDVSILREPVLAPIGIYAMSVDEGIKLFWQYSTNAKVKEFVIHRYQRGEEPKMISTIPADKTFEYIDKNVKSGQLYFYYLNTVSSDNIVSDQSEEIGIRK